MAKTGNGKQALELAKTIEIPGHRRFAIRDIARALAEQRAFKEAFNTALLLKHVEEEDPYGVDAYLNTLSEILGQLTRAGRVKEALASVPAFTDLKDHYRKLYGAIAAAQADTGDVQGARTTLALAETQRDRAVRRQEMACLVPLLKQGKDSQELRELRTLQRVDEEILMAREAIALGLAKRGDTIEATVMAQDLDYPDRERLIGEIGRVLVETNRTGRALRWTRSLTSSADKSFALVGIAGALNVSKNKNRSSL